MEFLSDKLLFKIFSHAKHDCNRVKLVCKRFYLLICEMKNIRKSLCISEEKLKDKDVYYSIINSKNIISEILIYSNYTQSMDTFYKLRTICSINASTITDVSWHKVKMTATEIIGILNLFPNLKFLCCDCWKIETEFYDEPAEPLKLERLTSLIIYKCNDATTALFNYYLPTNRLTSLTVNFYCKSYVNSLCVMSDSEEGAENDSELFNYKEEGVIDCVKPTLTHLRMQLQKYKINQETPLMSILQLQSNLVRLDVLSCSGVFEDDNESFVAICYLRNLKELSLNIDDVKPAVFKEHFHKLNKLEVLSIEALEEYYSSSLKDNIEELSKTRLEHLTSLTIQVKHTEISVNMIKQMGLNYPKLLQLSLACEVSHLLDVYLRSFETLTRIVIDYTYSQAFSDICNNLDCLCFPLIEHICLTEFYSVPTQTYRPIKPSQADLNEPAFLKLVKALPNITEMKIQISIPLNAKFLDKCLKMLPNLKIFEGFILLQQDEKFDENCVNYLIRIFEKLKSFSVELKLKSIDMDVYKIKTKLMEKFRFDIKRSRVETSINLKNKINRINYE
ncbi:hypothetical protein ACKWTF_006604 [Chironomus riparius]